MGLKAVIGIGPTSGGALTPADRRIKPILLPQRRLTIRDLLNKSTTSASSVEFAKQTVRTMDARVVSKGATKPESTIAFELATAPTRVIATWSKVSRQALSDAPMLRGLLDSELSYAVRLKEEEELLFGDGSGAHIFGIVPQSEAFVAPFSVTFENYADVIKQALSQGNTALLPSDGVVVNDGDLDKMQTLKDEEGRYLFGGPAGPPITTLWGKPVVGTPAMPPGDFLVGPSPPRRRSGTARKSTSWSRPKMRMTSYAIKAPPWSRNAWLSQ
jgi:HK97 family phage major capsid protein